MHQVLCLVTLTLKKTIIKSITENCITTATHLTDTIKGKNGIKRSTLME